MSAQWTDAIAPSPEDLEKLARTAFNALPAAVRAAAGDVEFHILEFADEGMLNDLGIENPFELSGLYDGVDRLHASVLDPIPQIPRIFLFRRPILDEWAERGDVTLGELVGNVLVHEIGHHMGLSDEDIEAIESAPD
jgi:predicted Zn-dependent protease with MMP-like domain